MKNSCKLKENFCNSKFLQYFVLMLSANKTTPQYIDCLSKIWLCTASNYTNYIPITIQTGRHLRKISYSYKKFWKHTKTWRIQTAVTSCCKFAAQTQTGILAQKLKKTSNQIVIHPKLLFPNPRQIHKLLNQNPNETQLYLKQKSVSYAFRNRATSDESHKETTKSHETPKT